MSFNIINQLREAIPGERPGILEKIYNRNIEHFKSKHPALLELFNNIPCPYRIDITENFLNIVDERTGQLAHPEAGLDRFAEMLGDWTHEAWVDLFNFHIPALEKYPKHHKIVDDFSTKLQQAFPELSQRIAGGRINLKHIDDDKRFSPPVVFLGIFHGLHIATYLEKTELTTALFIEPEPERFEASCYFLDYTEIERRFGTLYLAIGEETTAASIESFFSLLRITPLMWTRVLCGYPFEKAHFFIESLKSLQATNTNLLYPLDNELDGLIHGAININHGLPLLTTQPRVSKQCRIAVIATGPSLVNDLDWLKENQQHLIIFAVHSSVKILRKHGITPDFQFNLDSVIKYNFRQILELFPEVPFVTDYKAPPHVIADFEQPLLCADMDKNSAVHFQTSLSATHPSTTNLAFSFACFLKPASIYLLGCDCGYRELHQEHAKGSFYDEPLGQGKPRGYAATALQSLVEPNFLGTAPIQTISQHLQTKIVLERCITTNAVGISVVNLSDGALILGAKPQRSTQVNVPKYYKKQKDTKKILKAFSPAKEHVNWETYNDSGTERLRKLKTTLIDILTLDTFCWKKFSLALDNALRHVFTNNWLNKNDHRLDCFYRVLNDVLCLWYRGLILFDDIHEVHKIYRDGLGYFRESLEELQWIEPLDQVNHKDMVKYLPSAWKIYLAQLYGKQENFIKAQELILLAYNEAPEINDCLVRLGWILTKKRQWSEAFTIAVQDEQRNRLSPRWQVHLAQLHGRMDAFDHAVSLIDDAYATDTTLKDGFARLGWILAEQRHWPEAFAIAVQDEKRNRLSPMWQVHLAQLHGRMDAFDHAVSSIDEAYAADANLKDGFARLGWMKMEIKDWCSANECLRKDYEQGRMSAAWKIQFATLKGCLQHWGESKDLVAEAYAEDPMLNRDGYSRLGWWGYLLGRGEKFFHAQLEKDKHYTPRATSYQLHEALYLTAISEPDHAFQLVQQAYRNNATLENWYTILGWLQIRLGKFDRGHDLMKNDYTQGRMHRTWLASYAVALGICGKTRQALHILQNSSLRGMKNIVHPIGYTVFPEAWMTTPQVEEFVASKMSYTDLKNYSTPGYIA